MTVSTTILERFENLSMPEPNTGCHFWLGKRRPSDKYDYGQFRLNGKIEIAHRAIWIIKRGVIPVGMCILHRCDTPACVNIDHLFIGSQLDNMKDMVSKGRQASGDQNSARLHPTTRARGDRNGARLYPDRMSRGSDRTGWNMNPARGDRSGMRLHPESVRRGEKNGNAKLTDAKVREIRKRHAAGETAVSIASAFGCSSNLIGMVARRKIWKHVL